MTEKSSRDIRISALTRVEGEGALDIAIENGAITRLALNIYEPPRFFEKLLQGRRFDEIPDIVARICGICPVAYQMSALQAIESAFCVTVDPQVQRLRRLMYCGEWIQSHALHIHLLAAPDFFACDSVVELAKKQPGIVHRGLRLQALGNEILTFLGGRSVHPVGLRPGGFFRVPEQAQARALGARIAAALPEAEALVAWTAALPLPEDEQPFTSVALHHPDHYAIEDGRIRSSHGLDIAHSGYEQHFVEFQVPHSTALHAHLHGAPYLVGPLARLNLNHAQLPDRVAAVLAASGVRLPSANMFHSVVARAVEIFFALLEAENILREYAEPQAAHKDGTPRAAVGYGCTEAPRGILWHRYDFSDDGVVHAARIVPPTSQNQARMEQDLRIALTRLGLTHDDDTLRRLGERVIRNYDPCISCATHFLRLRATRS